MRALAGTGAAYLLNLPQAADGKQRWSASHSAGGARSATRHALPRAGY